MGSATPVYDLGRVPYRKALEFQRRAVELRARGGAPDVLYVVEHEPVLTVGRSGHDENLRAGGAELSRAGIEVVPVERGGDVTYHGPGQIVGYPIVDLTGLPGERDLHRYLRDLEEALIACLAAFGLEAARRPPYTGVWVGDRTVAAIGVAVRHWIAFHGFALNVNPNMSHFDLRLGEAIDRGAPLLAQEQQDGRDQRAGVADADPPDEVDDVEAPAHRLVVAPDADADEDQLGQRAEQHQRAAQRDEHPGVEPDRHPAEDDRADLVGDRGVRVPGRDHRVIDRPSDPGGIGDAHPWCAAAAWAPASSGLGFRTIAR